MSYHSDIKRGPEWEDIRPMTYFSYEQLISYLDKQDRSDLRRYVDIVQEFAQANGIERAPLLLTLMLYGEARGEPMEGQMAVLQVVFNRAQMEVVANIDSVLLKPYQFACFNRGNPTFSGLEHVRPGVWLQLMSRCVSAKQEYESTRQIAQVDDATLYCTVDCFRDMVIDWCEGHSAWDIARVRPRGKIGNHVFFAEL